MQRDSVVNVKFNSILDFIKYSLDNWRLEIFGHTISVRMMLREDLLKIIFIKYTN